MSGPCTRLLRLCKCPLTLWLAKMPLGTPNRSRYSSYRETKRKALAFQRLYSRLLDVVFFGKQRCWVHKLPVLFDFEMDMRPRRPTALAHGCNGLLAADTLSHLDQILAIVQVLRGIAIRMRDDHSQTVALLPTAKGDCPRECCANRCASRAGEIDAMMEFRFPGQWIRPSSLGGGQQPNHRRSYLSMSIYGWSGVGLRTPVGGRRGVTPGGRVLIL